jgi:hypothetical protein
MRNQLKDIYLLLGRVLNNPRAFGLGDRVPKALDDALSKLRKELMAELREEGPDEDFLEIELSQDADCQAFPVVTAKPFSLRKTGT